MADGLDREERQRGVPTMPASAALRISSGESSGERYRVMRYSTDGSMA